MRKIHRNRGADAEPALQFKAAAVQFDQRFDQRQAEAGAFVFSVERAVDLNEFGHRLGDVFSGDTDPFVGDLQGQFTGRVPPGPQYDPAAGGRELDAVRQQVEQNLLGDPPIGTKLGITVLEYRS